MASARRVAGPWAVPVLDADTEADIAVGGDRLRRGPHVRSVVSGNGPGHGPLPEHTARALASGLARALQDIHAAGLVHRDLKPSNILVTGHGPRVIDFGMTRALEAGPTAVCG